MNKNTLRLNHVTLHNANKWNSDNVARVLFSLNLLFNQTALCFVKGIKHSKSVIEFVCMSISQWFVVKIEELYKLITNSFPLISSPLEKWVCFTHSRELRLSSEHAHFFSIVPPFVCVLEFFCLLRYRLCVSKHIDLFSLVHTDKPLTSSSFIVNIKHKIY